MLSILLWVMALGPAGGRQRQAPREGIRIRPGWTFWALAAIAIVAAWFRLYDLAGTPPEMTSDHVEKILDAQRILDGSPLVFFPNNGGREPIQFYLMAAASRMPGLGMSFFTLKLLTAMEGLVTIPLLWLMGKAVIGDDDPELGNLTGLILAALVGVSYWHVMLSRLGLRIVLTTMFSAALTMFFAAALRHNRREDFIRVGLTLGAGFYAYQALRILPVVVAVGVGIAIVLARRQTARYLLNGAALATMALAVSAPLLTFALQYPEDFWRRAADRIGPLTAAPAPTLAILTANVRRALLMFNWRGDVAWVTAAPGRPVMDELTGALLIVGVGVWLVRAVGRRDPVDWLMPAMLLIMLLPSALAITHPIENPSATRTSGALPVAYLFAALPVALAARSVGRLVPDRQRAAASVALVGLVVTAAAARNWHTYFGEYHDSYLASSPGPYTEAGRMLRDFGESTGGYGNAFMIAYPYWWDHRALGIEAGRLDWPNGIVNLKDTPAILAGASRRQDRYRLDPARELMFFYSRRDSAAQAQLRHWFPEGRSRVIASYKPGGDYSIFQVAPLGASGFRARVE